MHTINTSPPTVAYRAPIVQSTYINTQNSLLPQPLARHMNTRPLPRTCGIIHVPHSVRHMFDF